MASISVICPVFNSSNFVEKTLSTLLIQSRKPDQIIIIDDGSQDSTIEVVTHFLTKNALNIDWEIIKSPHKGPGAARNMGIYHASSEWIAFIDSDDLWNYDKLEKVEDVIINNQSINFICHNELYKRQNREPKILKYTDLYTPSKSLVTQLYSANIFSTSAVVCTRSLLLKFNGFSEKLMSAQDYELWIRMSKSINLFFMSDVLGSYVERNGNITSSNIFKRMKNELKIAVQFRKNVNYVWFLVRVLRILLSFIKQFFESIKLR